MLWWRECDSPGKGGREVHLQQPRFEVSVNEHVKPVQLYTEKQKEEKNTSLEASAGRRGFIKLWDLEAGWISKFYYHSIMWHLATRPMPFCTLLHACYVPNHHSPLLSLGSVTFTTVSMYTFHLSGRCSRSGADQNHTEAVKYFHTCRESFSHYGGGWAVYVLSLYINKNVGV